MKWMDKRVVASLFTIDSDSIGMIERQTNISQEEAETIQKSAIINIYDTYMGGVDKKDQLFLYTKDLLTFKNSGN